QGKPKPLTCFGCGSEKHLQRDCPKPKTGAASSTVKYVDSEIDSLKHECAETEQTEEYYDARESDDYQTDGDTGQETEEDTEYEQEYEEDDREYEGSDSASSQVNFLRLTVNQINCLPRNALGPSVRMPARVEDVEFNSVLDCGSGISILSGGAAWKIANSKVDPDREFWTKTKPLAQDSPLFGDYHGNRLNLTRYIEANVQLGALVIPVTFMIDPKGTQEVLLGTRVLNDT
ncbi:MAG: hypothetical protein GY737_26640, partial [Desulfobacteraceae bacterium]|nr:hypothetical protein [Desulfobacteraceae bacterium]